MLEDRPDISSAWIDHTCLPQGRRTEQEQRYLNASWWRVDSAMARIGEQGKRFWPFSSFLLFFAFFAFFVVFSTFSLFFPLFEKDAFGTRSEVFRMRSERVRNMFGTCSEYVRNVFGICSEPFWPFCFFPSVVAIFVKDCIRNAFSSAGT